jgi:GNAT superfamily N-acetyltransferase
VEDFMTEPRAPLETEVPNLIGFLDKHLRSTQGWSIAAEYPQVFTPANRGNIRIIGDGDKIIAHAAIKYLLIKNVAGLFKVAAIGSVVTDPAHRQQGLSQKIIESCLEAAYHEGADFAILWTDLYDFYRKMGFELAGTEISVVIESAPPADASGLKFINSEKISPDAISRLYSQHTCGTLRTSEDIRRFLSIPNTHVYTAWNDKNELMAYAIEGKGADLKGYIHEWGGGVSSLLPLFGHIRRTIGTPITIIAPQQSQNLIRHLSDWNVTMNEGFLGMIRPVNVDNLFFKIRRYARQLGLHDFVLESTPSGYTIGRKNDVATIQGLGELTRLIFGPLDTTILKPEFQKLFPLPMWVWGWDSI